MVRLNESRIGVVLGDDVGVRATTHTFTTTHAAHGVGLFVTLDHDIAVRSPSGAVCGRAVIVPAGIEHAFESPGTTIGICIDSERWPRVAGFARASGRPIVLDGRIARQLVGGAEAHRGYLDRADVLEGLAREACSALSGLGSAVRVDNRVARVVEALRDGAGVPRLAISDGHLQELFVRDVGAPIRSYRLWRRLLRALAAFVQTDATTAAHAAGFSDLAHFSRTCRRLLGYSPTTLRDGV
jgi:AraC-like DNA-binding protein